jgi:predicted nuclease with TOPRIM domain
MNSITEKIDNINQKLSTHNNNMVTFHENAMRKIDEIKGLISKIKELVERYKKKSENASQLELEIRMLMNTINDYANRNQELRNKIKTLEIDGARNQDEREKITKLMEEMNEIKEEREQLQKSLNMETEGNKNLTIQNEELNKRINEYQEQIGKLERENHTIQSELENLKIVLSTDEDRLKIYEDELKLKQAKIDNLQKEIAEYEEKITAILAFLDNFNGVNEKNKAITEGLESIKEELNKILQDNPAPIELGTREDLFAADAVNDDVFASTSVNDDDDDDDGMPSWARSADDASVTTTGSIYGKEDPIVREGNSRSRNINNDDDDDDDDGMPSWASMPEEATGAAGDGPSLVEKKTSHLGSIIKAAMARPNEFKESNTKGPGTVEMRIPNYNKKITEDRRTALQNSITDALGKQSIKISQNDKYNNDANITKSLSKRDHLGFHDHIGHDQFRDDVLKSMVNWQNEYKFGGEKPFEDLYPSFGEIKEYEVYETDTYKPNSANNKKNVKILAHPFEIEFPKMHPSSSRVGSGDFKEVSHMGQGHIGGVVKKKKATKKNKKGKKGGKTLKYKQKRRKGKSRK